jgi:hypothetical protein
MSPKTAQPAPRVVSPGFALLGAFLPFLRALRALAGLIGEGFGE